MYLCKGWGLKKAMSLLAGREVGIMLVDDERGMSKIWKKVMTSYVNGP